ncbi:MAG TPA: GNAT family protein [Thermoanaerobaculia bacterium]
MIELIPFTEDDIDRVIPWINSHQELLFWTAHSFGYPLTREHLLGHMLDCAAAGDRLIFKAVDLDSGEAVGYIELGAIDRRDQSLRIGRVLLAPAFRGRGFGVEMMRAALRKSFDELGMHRVTLHVLNVNPQAIACYEKVGFRHEGVGREAFKAPEGYWDILTMSILAPEWEALR